MRSGLPEKPRVGPEPVVSTGVSEHRDGKPARYSTSSPERSAAFPTSCLVGLRWGWLGLLLATGRRSRTGPGPLPPVSDGINLELVGPILLRRVYLRLQRTFLEPWVLSRRTPSPRVRVTADRGFLENTDTSGSQGVTTENTPGRQVRGVL